MIENVRELRVDNIVNCYSSIHKENRPFYVTQIFVDEVELENEDESFRIMVDRVKGIPLTEELLLECGLKKCHHGFYNDYIELSYGYLLLGVCEGHDDELFVSVNSAEYAISCNVKYLHQLQNICYALTGQELEVEL